MVHQYLELLPDQASTQTVVLLTLLAGAGALLWVAGARFSRYLVTLLTVLMGASVGMQLPRWFGWEISGAGPAVGAAVLLGVTGFTVHGGWTGAILGLTLALWSAFVTWLVVTAGEPINWPPITEFTTVVSFCQDWWYALPPQVAKLLPYTTAAAMVSGLALAILWTRLTTVLAWSLAGTTMLAGGTLSAVQLARPHWLDGGVPGTAVQVAILLGIVVIGAAIQWKLAPATRAHATKRNGKGKASGDKSEDRAPDYAAA